MAVGPNPRRRAQGLLPAKGAQVDWGDPLNKGLLAAFPLNEGAGKKAFDATKRQGPAAFYNSLAWTTLGLNFPAFGGFLVATSAFSGMTADWTYSFWIKLTATGITQHLLQDTGFVNIEFILFSDNTLAVAIPPGAAVVQSTMTIADTTRWHHIVGTKRGTQFTLYIDGKVADQQTSGTAQSALTTTLDFGVDSLTGYGRDLRIWNRALSRQDVQSLYALPARGYLPQRMWSGGTAGAGSPQTATADTATSTVQFGTPSASVGAVTLSPSGLASTVAFGAPSLTPGAVTLAPAGLAATTAFGAVTLTGGVATLLPAGLPSTVTFGVPTLTGGVRPVETTGGSASGVPKGHEEWLRKQKAKRVAARLAAKAKATPEAEPEPEAEEVAQPDLTEGFGAFAQAMQYRPTLTPDINIDHYAPFNRAMVHIAGRQMEAARAQAAARHAQMVAQAAQQPPQEPDADQIFEATMRMLLGPRD